MIMSCISVDKPSSGESAEGGDAWLDRVAMAMLSLLVVRSLLK
jgi:hypothetical protein